MTAADARYIRLFRDITLDDVPLVGGKTASLGELHRELRGAGLRVPDGFAITADAYTAILDADGVRGRIARLLHGIDGHDVAALAKAGAAIRALVEAAAWPVELERAVEQAYAALGGPDGRDVAVAVRSSATAEDLPEASFAGQQETFLGVRGAADLGRACRRCFASLFTDRAIAYRIDHGFDHLAVRLSIAVQHMVRSDLGVSGVMFTLDPDSGFDGVVLIESSYGLGEAIVGGQVDPDSFWLFKPTLARGSDAILKRSVGSKTWKLVLGPDGLPQRAEVPAADADVMSLPGHALGDVHVLTRPAGDGDRPLPHALDVEQRGQQGAGRTPGGKDRQRFPAQLANRARDVDATAAGLVDRRLAAELMVRGHVVDARAHVDGGIHRERGDGGNGCSPFAAAGHGSRS